MRRGGQELRPEDPVLSHRAVGTEDVVGSRGSMHRAGWVNGSLDNLRKGLQAVAGNRTKAALDKSAVVECGSVINHLVWNPRRRPIPENHGVWSMYGQIQEIVSAAVPSITRPGELLTWTLCLVS